MEVQNYHAILGSELLVGVLNFVVESREGTHM